MRRCRYRDAAGHVRAVNDRIYLNSAFLLDVAWWRRNIEHFNGFVSIVDADATCDIRIDATGLGGVGVFCDGGFVALSGAQLRQHYLGIGHPDTSSSTEWALFGFLVAVRAFRKYMQGKHVLICNDNLNAVRFVRRFSVAGIESVYCAAVLRELFELSVRFNIRTSPRWIAGDVNKLADALSRLNWRLVQQELAAYVNATWVRSSKWVQSW